MGAGSGKILNISVGSETKKQNQLAPSHHSSKWVAILDFSFSYECQISLSTCELSLWLAILLTFPYILSLKFPDFSLEKSSLAITAVLAAWYSCLSQWVNCSSQRKSWAVWLNLNLYSPGSTCTGGLSLVLEHSLYNISYQKYVQFCQDLACLILLQWAVTPYSTRSYASLLKP